MYTPEVQIEKLLRGLGKTPNAVARKLLKHDCKGKQGCSEACPVWAYVTKYGPSVYRVGGYVSADTFVQVLVPEPVSDFIEAFDNGDYPALEITGKKKKKRKA